MEEVKTLQHIINDNIEYMQELREWLDKEKIEVIAKIQALEDKSLGTEEGYLLIESLPIDVLYRFLLKVYVNIVR